MEPQEAEEFGIFQKESDIPPSSKELDLSNLDALCKEGPLPFEKRAMVLWSLITDVTLRNSFMAFLSNEHCEELLLFLEDVRRCEEKEEVHWCADADAIYKRFIHPGSSNEVELPSQVRKTLEIFFENSALSKDASVFADAKSFVEHALMNGEMLKFLKSPSFQKIVAYKADRTVIEKKSSESKVTTTPLHAGAAW